MSSGSVGNVGSWSGGNTVGRPGGDKGGNTVGWQDGDKGGWFGADATMGAAAASRHPKMSMADRAAQFMPFAALTGYYDIVREVERPREPRHELNDEETARVNEALLALAPRDLVRVTYYDRDAYVTQEGVVVHIDVSMRELQVVRTHISFDDIASLEVVGHL